MRQLPLSFDSQMRNHFMESHFHSSAQDEPLQDLLWLHGQIGTEQRLRFEPSLGIADQLPADGKWGHAIVVPNGIVA